MTIETAYAKRILLVDDDDDVLHSVGFLLKHAGYVVYAASCRQRSQLATGSSVAIIDVRLGQLIDDISGLYVADRIPDMPKIVYTAYPTWR
jgi:CheY-like chemotaxis protein